MPQRYTRYVVGGVHGAVGTTSIEGAQRCGVGRSYERPPLATGSVTLQTLVVFINRRTQPVMHTAPPLKRIKGRRVPHGDGGRLLPRSHGVPKSTAETLEHTRRPPQPQPGASGIFQGDRDGVQTANTVDAHGKSKKLVAQLHLFGVTRAKLKEAHGMELRTYRTSGGT